jgi:hypothetical protein
MTQFLQMGGSELGITEDPDEIAMPNCHCVETVSGYLQVHFATSLGTHAKAAGGSPAPIMYTRRSKFADRPPFVIPRFCPFCGIKYGKLEATGAPETWQEQVERRLQNLEAQVFSPGAKGK